MTVKEISEIAGLSGAAHALVQEDSTPSAYLDSLEKQNLYQDGIKFLAYRLAVDVGVKWACACVRELQAPELKAQKNEALEACERWAQAPADPARWEARKASDEHDAKGASKLVAMAVFFSGGSIAGPGAPATPPPPNTGQKLIAGAIPVAVISYKPEQAEERYKRALAMGRALDLPG